MLTPRGRAVDNFGFGRLSSNWFAIIHDDTASTPVDTCSQRLSADVGRHNPQLWLSSAKACGWCRCRLINCNILPLYNRNRICSKTDLCGTAYGTYDDGLDHATRTCWSRPCRYDENQLITSSSSPYEILTVEGECRDRHCRSPQRGRVV